VSNRIKEKGIPRRCFGYVPVKYKRRKKWTIAKTANILMIAEMGRAGRAFIRKTKQGISISA
jgi:hypothetical protein